MDKTMIKQKYGLEGDDPKESRATLIRQQAKLHPDANNNREMSEDEKILFVELEGAIKSLSLKVRPQSYL